MILEKVFTTVDTHVLGETYRIVTQSPIQFTGTNINENDEFLQNNYAIEKKLILNEPRGHRGINGCIVLPSTKADYQLLFFNHEGVSCFQYEGLFASLTALLETGNISRTKDNLYKIETIQGVYALEAEYVKGEILSLRLNDIFAEHIQNDNGVDKVRIDNNRNYFVYELPDSIDTIDMTQLGKLSTWGTDETIKYNENNERYEGVVLVEPVSKDENKFISLTFERDGYIRRTPSIDSTVAIYEALANKAIDTISNNTIFNSSLIVTKEEHDRTFSVSLRSFVTGSHQFVYDKDDPLIEGFILK